MTSRKLITGGDELSSLKIGSAVAEALVSVLQRIEVRPRYIVAKVRDSKHMLTSLAASREFLNSNIC